MDITGACGVAHPERHVWPLCGPSRSGCHWAA